MAKVNAVHVDKNALEKILNSEKVESAAKGVGDRVAENASEHIQHDGAECDAKMYKTTYKGMRGPVAVVALKHPAGKNIEAKRGPLRKGATAAGIKVRQRDTE